MADTLLQQGLDLLSFGMGTVFVFLTLLVMATALMSRVIGRFLPDAPAVVPTVAANSRKTVDAKTLRIIQAALNKHRERK